MPLFSLEASEAVQNIYCHENVPHPSVWIDVQLNKPINPISRYESTDISAKVTVLLDNKNKFYRKRFENDVHIIKRGRKLGYKMRVVWGADAQNKVNILDIAPVIRRSFILRVETYSGEYSGTMIISNLGQEENNHFAGSVTCVTDDGQVEE